MQETIFALPGPVHNAVHPNSYVYVQAAPLPRLQASLPGQLAAVPTPTRAPAPAPAPAPAQRNPDADSDEEDFMNAAIAAVEGRGPPPEQVLLHFGRPTSPP